MTANSGTGLTAIVKTTHDCNLGCLYCYTDPNAEKGRMDSETTRNMILKIAKQNRGEGHTTFIWHGGEPLLMGIDFYREAIDVQGSIDGHIFSNDIQTNGTLLTEGYLDFFEQYHFNVGLSLDGNRRTHDATRPYQDGCPSFSDVFASVLEVRRRGLGGGVICVLNANTSPNIEEIYWFFKKNKIHPKINFQIPSGRALDAHGLQLTNKQLGQAMIRLFDLWFDDYTQPVIEIQPFVDIMGNIGAYRNTETKVDYPYSCIFKNNCANSYISVVPGGNVYPCGRSAGNPQFHMGNINTDSMDDILASRPRKLLLQRHEESVQSCEPCDFRPICNSGCPDNAYLFTGDALQKDGFCSAYRVMFSHIEQRMRQELGAK